MLTLKTVLLFTITSLAAFTWAAPPANPNSVDDADLQYIRHPRRRRSPPPLAAINKHNEARELVPGIAGVTARAPKDSEEITGVQVDYAEDGEHLVEFSDKGSLAED